MADGLGLSMKMTELFFDRPAVLAAIDKQRAKALRRSGGRVRKIARRSMRRVSKSKQRKAREARIKALRAGQRTWTDPSISKPGSPPNIHARGKFSPKLILFAYDPSTKSVVTGPVRGNTSHNVVEALERGGNVPVYTGTRRNRRMLKTEHIAARPFMRPALEKAQDDMAADWAGIIK